MLHVTKYVAAKIGTFKSSMASDLSVMGFIVGQGPASAAMSILLIVYNLEYAKINIVSLALNVILINNLTSITLPYLSAKLAMKRSAGH
ncbi:MAG: hypothetical protein QXX08_10980 [Candidatus Bathyarchaeia archaeon]